MAGVLNKTGRQFNLKCLSPEGGRVTVRLAPGFNVVNDTHWGYFVPKKGKVDKYVEYLSKKGFISYGSKEDDLELEQDPDTASKSKVTPATGNKTPKASKAKTSK